MTGGVGIRIEGLGKRYGESETAVEALKDVHMSVEPGEVVGLIGPSGSGKTTLLKCLGAVIEPTRGRMTLGGQVIYDAGWKIGDLRVLRRDRIGFIFQAPYLIPFLDATDNVALLPMLAGRPNAEARERARELLEALDVAHRAKAFPSELSGGEQQRVSIARALGFEPKILMMDEPFGALDEITRDRLNAQLQQLWQRERRTVVFVTHSIAEAVYLSTRIVVMSPRPGRILKVIDSPLPAERTLDMRDTPEFMALAHEVREGLAEGHGADDV